MTPAIESELLRQVDALRTRVSELEAWNEQAQLAAEALRQSTDTFRMIFDHSNDAIFVVDPERDRIVDANRRASEMLGYAPSELLGMPVSAIHPHETERLRDFARSVTRDGQGWTAELSCRTRGGSLVPAEISASLLQLSSARYVIALVRDISERKRAELALRKVNDRLRADLEAAAQTQRALLPSRSLRIDGLECAWRVRPCERLGGDTLNVVPLPDRHVGLYLIDVSGHGVMAAMLSVALHRALAPYPCPTSVLVSQEGKARPRPLPPARVAAAMNDLFPFDTASRQYFTMFYATLDLARHTLSFVSAGQGAPVHVPHRGPIAPIEARGFPIGVMPAAEFEQHEITVAPGDRVYVWSDGLEDAIGLEGRPFGRERVLQAIEQTRESSLGDSVQALFDRMERWSGSDGAVDDASLLAFEIPRGRK